MILMTGACATDVEDPADEFLLGEPAVLVEPSLQGSLGRVLDFQGVPEVTGFADSDFTSLDVRTRGVGWAAMAGLNIHGQLGQGEFAVGKHIVVNTNEWPLDPRLNMFGRSGPADSQWDYDCEPDVIGLQISEGRTGGEFRLDLVASFDDDCHGPGTYNGHWLSAIVDVIPPPRSG